MQKSEISVSAPFFSIGITTYNRKEMLKECLRSILSQTFTDFEIIVGNDFIEDKLSCDDLFLCDHRIRIINNQRNLGELDNLNNLLRISQGKYFTWQADDDYYAPNFFQEVYKAIMTHGVESICVLTSFKVVRSKSIPLQTLENEIQVKKVIVYGGQKFLHDYWNGRIKVMGLVGVYKKPYLISLGGLKKLTNMPIAIFSEYLLILQISLLKKVIYIDAPLIYYRAHQESWSASNKNYESYEIAGINFLKLSMEIFRISLDGRNYFQENLTGAMKLILRDVSKINARRGNLIVSILNIKFLGTLKSLIITLKGTELYYRGVLSYFCVLLWFLLYFPKILLITIMPNSIKIIAKKIRSFVRDEIA